MIACDLKENQEAMIEEQPYRGWRARSPPWFSPSVPTMSCLGPHDSLVARLRYTGDHQTTFSCVKSEEGKANALRPFGFGMAVEWYSAESMHTRVLRWLLQLGAIMPENKQARKGAFRAKARAVFSTWTERQAPCLFSRHEAFEQSAFLLKIPAARGACISLLPLAGFRAPPGGSKSALPFRGKVGVAGTPEQEHHLFFCFDDERGSLVVG